jgi:hypothetical protein
MNVPAPRAALARIDQILASVNGSRDFHNEMAACVRALAILVEEREKREQAAEKKG